MFRRSKENDHQISADQTAGLFTRFEQYLEAGDRDLLSQFLTVPNAVSTASALSVWDGANKMGTLEGLAKMTGGRIGDLTDGLLARLLHQESQFGAALDAGLDKLSVAKITYEAWKREAVPREQLASIMASQTLNFCTTTLAACLKPDRQWRPSKVGKLGMALDNVCLLSHIAGYTADQMIERKEFEYMDQAGLERVGKLLHILGDTAFVAGRPMAAAAAGDYIGRLAPGDKAGSALKLGGVATGLAVSIGAGLKTASRRQRTGK